MAHKVRPPRLQVKPTLGFPKSSAIEQIERIVPYQIFIFENRFAIGGLWRNQRTRNFCYRAPRYN
ncbi:MAG: hypothetical protein ACI9FD_004804 [Gammaproteobacteria bacterium]